MIKIYDGVFTDKQCKKLIDKFQHNEEQHEIFNNDVMQFTQYNFTAHHPQSKLHSQLSEQVAQLARRYFPDVFVRVLTNIGGLEQFSIKKYNPGGEFKLHIDVMNRESSIRAVGFLFYLNDSDGYTDFINHNIRVEPKAGRVVVFPPTWEYPHIGQASSKDKYIMSTYLHYGTDNENV